MSDEKKKITTSQPMSMQLRVVIERDFPSTGAIKMSCPACRAHGIGADEKEAFSRLMDSIREKEKSAWILD